MFLSRGAGTTASAERQAAQFKARFLADIEQHYARLERAHATNNRAVASQILQQFRTNGQLAYRDVKELEAKYETERLLSELETVKDPASRLSRYEKLLTYHPNNEEYAAAVVPLRAEARKQQELAERQRQEKQAKAQNTARVHSQFSSWDGSHPGLVKAVKAGMHNPESFEHVETRFSDQGETISVIMKFRGTNGFGGVVTQSVIGLVDLRGSVLEWAYLD